MSTAHDPRELHRLFTAKADGAISETEHARLASLLSGSASARAAWFAFEDAEAALLAWAQREATSRGFGPAFGPQGGTEHPRDPAPPLRSTRPGIGTGRAVLAAGIALTLACLAVVMNRYNKVPDSGATPELPAESTSPSVALLSRGVNMRWQGGGDPPGLNSPLAPGPLRLESGVAEIEFFQGARLWVEGPAELELLSAGEAACRSGRFRAHVPPQARGFTLQTPNGRLVDLGTDFGVDLNTAAPEVHVFKGEVELHQPNLQVQTLSGGFAVYLDQSRLQTKHAADAAAFGFNDLDAVVRATQSRQFEHWRNATAQIIRSTDLLLHLDFQEGPGARALQNTAAHGRDILPASIVGCAWTEGRWPGKHALEFRSLSDRVRLSVPGEFGQFSAVAWVHLHGVNIKQSSICMSEGMAQGSIHWQVLHDGSLCLGVAHGPNPDLPAWEDHISPVVFTPERHGQWVNVAVVYDAAAGEVRHYFDGVRVSRHPIKAVQTLTPGLVELGNWNSPPKSEFRKQPVRNFIGCMDEFSLYSKALKDAEVRRLYEINSE